MRKKRNNAIRCSSRCNIQILNPEIIRQAMEGDEIAIRAVVQHYQPVIAQKALRLGVDKFGRQYWYVDPLVSGQMESQLMKAILTFGKHH